MSYSPRMGLLKDRAYHFDENYVLWAKVQPDAPFHGTVPVGGFFAYPQRLILPHGHLEDEIRSAGLRIMYSEMVGQKAGRPNLARFVCAFSRSSAAGRSPTGN